MDLHHIALGSGKGSWILKSHIVNLYK